MPKSIIYEYRERDDLFLEHFAETHPEKTDIHGFLRIQPTNVLLKAFAEICNKYGELGWDINPLPIQSGDRLYYQFKKVSYPTKKEQLKSYADKIVTWAGGVGHSDQRGSKVITIADLKKKMLDLAGIKSEGE